MYEVRVRTYGGAISTIEKVVYEIVDGEETDEIITEAQKIKED